MTALSVPANLLSPPTKGPAQSNSAQPEAETPFASVLQQKVQSGKDEKEASPAGEPGVAQSEPAQTAQAAQTADQADASTAAAVINGDYAQNALQQLLPWLQSLQGKDVKIDTTEAAPTSDSLPAALAAAQTPATLLPGPVETTQRDVRKSAGDTSIELPPGTPKAGTEAASGTANLAAPTELLTEGGKHKPAHDGFDNALQGASEKLETQSPQIVATANAAVNRTSEPTRLLAPLGTPQWQHELGDRVQLMSRNNESRAELVLTPPQLGRIEVTLNISGDQASALFVSASPEVRIALEGAMDRLREALASNGIALGQAQVGADSSGQSASNGQSGSRQGSALSGGVQDAATASSWTRHSNNMLDVFA